MDDASRQVLEDLKEHARRMANAWHTEFERLRRREEQLFSDDSKEASGE